MTIAVDPPIAVVPVPAIVPMIVPVIPDVVAVIMPPIVPMVVIRNTIRSVVCPITWLPRPIAISGTIGTIAAVAWTAGAIVIARGSRFG